MKSITVSGYIRHTNSKEKLLMNSISIEIFLNNISYYFESYIEYEKGDHIILAMNNGQYIIVKKSAKMFKEICKEAEKTEQIVIAEEATDKSNLLSGKE